MVVVGERGFVVFLFSWIGFGDGGCVSVFFWVVCICIGSFRSFVL